MTKGVKSTIMLLQSTSATDLLSIQGKEKMEQRTLFDMSVIKEADKKKERIPRAYVKLSGMYINREVWKEQGIIALTENKRKGYYRNTYANATSMCEVIRNHNWIYMFVRKASYPSPVGIEWFRVWSRIDIEQGSDTWTYDTASNALGEELFEMLHLFIGSEDDSDIDAKGERNE